MVVVNAFSPDLYLLMATRLGEIKKTQLNNFASVRTTGIIAMDLEKDDELVAACLAADADDILLVTRRGQSIRFPVAQLRTSSRTSGGVRGMRLRQDDQVVSMDVVYPGGFVLIVSMLGYGKLTHIEEYRRQGRAGSGIKTFKITEKTGEVAAARLVSPTNQLMIISAEGIVIRTPVKEKDGHGIRITSRSAQGVRLMRLDEGDRVVAIANFE